MYVTAYNTSSDALTVDAEGRTIGAQEWGTASTTTEPAKEAIDAGTLIVQDVPDDGHPDAIAARDRTALISGRYDAFNALDKDVLVEAATEAEVPGADELHKPDLVHALACRVTVPVPESTPDPADAVIQGEAPSGETAPDPAPEAEQPAESATKQSSRRRAGRE